MAKVERIGVVHPQHCPGVVHKDIDAAESAKLLRGLSGAVLVPAMHDDVSPFTRQLDGYCGAEAELLPEKTARLTASRRSIFRSYAIWELKC